MGGKRRHKDKKAKPKQKILQNSTETLTEQTKKCPTCGGPVQVEVTKKGNKVVHGKITAAIWDNLPPERPELLEHLKKEREGKRTLCILGTSPDNCNLAPWGEGLDMWAVNDAHRLGYMEPHIKEMTGWFQMHHRWRWMQSKEIPGSERMRYGGAHFDFLRAEDLKFPVYMQQHYEDIPRSVEYPIREATEDVLFKKIQRGFYWQRKYFTCSFAYMGLLAVWSRTPRGQEFFKHDGFERVEMYGVQLAQKIEYQMQKPSTEFWIGMMIASGMEVYLPENGYLLSGETYGYRFPHGNPSLGQIDEDNIGWWDWGDGLPDYGFKDKITWG
jgi:hypothetical protein